MAREASSSDREERPFRTASSGVGQPRRRTPEARAERLAQHAAETDPAAVLAAAVRLLEARPRTVKDLSSRLVRSGYPAALVEEIYRVLKPGGKVLMVTPALHDAQFWSHCIFPWRDWLRRQTAPHGGMSRRGLRRLFGRFTEHRIHKRHLRRSESPYLLRGLPLPVLERLMGRFLVLKAFKPLSAALSLQIAA